MQTMTTEEMGRLVETFQGLGRYGAEHWVEMARTDLLELAEAGETTGQAWDRASRAYLAYCDALPLAFGKEG